MAELKDCQLSILIELLRIGWWRSIQFLNLQKIIKMRSAAYSDFQRCRALQEWVQSKLYH